MSKEEFIKKAKDKYKELFGENYDDKIASESAENLWSNASGNSDRALASLKFITDKSGRMKENFSSNDSSKIKVVEYIEGKLNWEIIIKVKELDDKENSLVGVVLENKGSHYKVGGDYITLFTDKQYNALRSNTDFKQLYDERDDAVRYYYFINNNLFSNLSIIRSVITNKEAFNKLVNYFSQL